MPAPRKFDRETRERAVRLYVERRRDHPNESLLTARKQVGALLDINQATLRNWIEDRAGTGGGAGTAVDAEVSAEVKALRKEVAELRRANEILKTASAFFAAAEVDRRLA